MSLLLRRFKSSMLRSSVSSLNDHDALSSGGVMITLCRMDMPKICVKFFRAKAQRYAYSV